MAQSMSQQYIKFVLIFVAISELTRSKTEQKNNQKKHHIDYETLYFEHFSSGLVLPVQEKRPSLFVSPALRTNHIMPCCVQQKMKGLCVAGGGHMYLQGIILLRKFLKKRVVF